MNTIVHNDEPTRRRCVLSKGVPGVEQNGDVVVPVQEDQRLLTQYDEHRVAELREFGQHEHPCPEAGHFVLLNETGIEKREDK